MEVWHLWALHNFGPALTTEVTQVLGSICGRCVGAKWELAVSLGVRSIWKARLRSDMSAVELPRRRAGSFSA